MDLRPDDHDRVGALPHDPPVTASCPACGWHEDMCHCPPMNPTAEFIPEGLPPSISEESP